MSQSQLCQNDCSNVGEIRCKKSMLVKTFPYVGNQTLVKDVGDKCIYFTDITTDITSPSFFKETNE